MKLELVRKNLEQARILKPVDSITNFEIQNYYQNEPKFDGVHSKNNLSKTKYWVYLVNIDENKSVEWFYMLTVKSIWTGSDRD